MDNFESPSTSQQWWEQVKSHSPLSFKAFMLKQNNAEDEDDKQNQEIENKVANRRDQLEWIFENEYYCCVEGCHCMNDVENCRSSQMSVIEQVSEPSTSKSRMFNSAKTQEYIGKYSQSEGKSWSQKTTAKKIIGSCKIEQNCESQPPISFRFTRSKLNQNKRK